MSGNGKNVHEVPEIEVFFQQKVNVTIRYFTWGLTNDHDLC